MKLRILAGAMAAAAALTTTFWPEGLRAVRREGTYEEARIRGAFRGIPVDTIARRLDELIPRDRAVALSGELTSVEFIGQRMTEGLYPRSVDQTSLLRLDAIAPGQDPAGALPLAPSGRALIVLRGLETQAPRENAVEAASNPGHPLSWLRFLACLASLLGLGAWVALPGVRRDLSATLLFPSCLLGGGLVLGLLGSLGTWMQLPLFGRWITYAGWIGLVPLVIFAWRHRGPLGVRLQPELWVAAVLMGGMAFRLTRLPVTLWDGRSVWLFHAKRLFTHGMLPESEILSPATVWSHADYPLLFPSWLAHFSSLDAAFNERMASLGIVTLFASCLVLFWILARRKLGRFEAAAIATAFCLALDTSLAGGYSDPHLMLLLAAAPLAFLTGVPAAGWLCLAFASFLKAEGFYLAAAVAGVMAVAPASGATVRLRATATAAACFAPALLHKLWALGLGQDSVFKGITAGQVARNLFGRVLEAVWMVPYLLTNTGYTRVRTMLWEGLAGALAAACLWVWLRRFPWAAKAVALTALVHAAFAFAALGALPEDVRWLATTALDRLLIHPAALLALAPFLFEDRDAAG